MRFSFIGTFNLDESNEKQVRRGVSKTGGEYISLNPSVIEKQNNRGRCELFGVKSDVIKTKDSDGNNIEVSWEDRKDPKVMASVANYRKTVITLNGKRNEFISSYDACEFILDNLTMLADKRVCVTGQSQKDFYQGRASDRFVISAITEISENDKRKNGLVCYPIIFWDKSCLDTTDFKDEKKIYINGYTSEYIKEESGNRYVASQFVLDCSKIDFKDEEHIKKLRARLIELGLDFKDGKLVNNMKAKGYAGNEFVAYLINGAEEVDFSIEQCTEKQKLYIELGMAKLEDFRPIGSLFGNWTTEIKIDRARLNGKDYPEGMEYLDEKPSEFEEMIYVPLADEKLDDFEKDMNPPEEIDDDEIDDLFAH